MKLVRALRDFPPTARGGAVSIGNFDGVHRGHAQILRRLRTMADRLGGPTIAFSFDPSPARLLRPQHAPPLLSTIERRAELMEALGVDFLVAYPTDPALLSLEATAFFEQIIVAGLGVRGIIEGPDFHFGAHRSGNVEVLRHLCAQAAIELEIVQQAQCKSVAVSSSHVRHLIAAGHVEDANRLLTAPYRLSGLVVHGAGRGRTLGFPTANIGHPPMLLPADGIYAGHSKVDGTVWPAAINVGPNPTFGENARKIEVYLIGYSGDLYDRVLDVDFLAKIRGVQKFASAEELIVQMKADCAATETIFKSKKVHS